MFRERQRSESVEQEQRYAEPSRVARAAQEVTGSSREQRSAFPWLSLFAEPVRPRRTRAREFPEHLAPVMIVKSPPHARVRAVGLGRFVPANTIHVTSAHAVVAGDRCKLTEVNHYHVHRATVNMAPLRRLSGAGREALASLLEDPTDTRAIHAFQRALETRATPPADGGTRVKRPVSAQHDVFVNKSAVQTGSDSTTKVHANYVVEETVIPLADLLKEDTRLVTRFAEAMRAPDSGEEMTAFCRLLLDAVDEVDELTRLAQATDITQVHDTTLRSFFGIAHVTAASAVLIGQDNELTEKLDVDLPEIGRRGLLADLDDLRELHGFTVQAQAEIAEPSPPPHRREPDLPFPWGNL